MKTEVYTRNDLIAYALIYAAMADYSISEEEKDFITDRVGKKEFKKMRDTFHKRTHTIVVVRIPLATKVRTWTPKRKHKNALKYGEKGTIIEICLKYWFKNQF